MAIQVFDKYAIPTTYLAKSGPGCTVGMSFNLHRTRQSAMNNLPMDLSGNTMVGLWEYSKPHKTLSYANEYEKFDKEYRYIQFIAPIESIVSFFVYKY